MYSLLLNYNNRAKNYLKIFKEKKIYFNYVVICNSKKKIIKYPYSKKTLVFENKKFDNKILNEINLRKIKKIIISPGDGEIIDKSFLKNKEILHCHPGNLPMFKGSAIIYYSILETQKVYCSIIKLNQKIDNGSVIFRKRFKLPNLKKLNYINYDHNIRATTFVEFLKRKKNNKIKKKKDLYLPFYIPHPIIRYLCQK